MQEVCDKIIYEPSCLPLEIKRLESCASDGKKYFNLKHNCDNYYYPINYGSIEYENDDELVVTNSPNSLNLIKNRCDPIYVKINQKGKFNITHIGFLGSKIPVKSFYKKKSKETNKQLRYCKRLTRKICHMYDSSVGFSYVKKIEIWFRGDKTKKWNFLKHVTLNFNGLTSCFEENIVPIFTNFNETQGLNTNELKIIPIEYVNAPSIRIAIYGNINKETKNKTNNSDDKNIVEYTVSKRNNDKYILKDSHSHHGYLMERNKKRTKRELENVIKNVYEEN